jgi:hypothetical protein
MQGSDCYSNLKKYFSDIDSISAIDALKFVVGYFDDSVR